MEGIHRRRRTRTATVLLSRSLRAIGALTRTSTHSSSPLPLTVMMRITPRSLARASYASSSPQEHMTFLPPCTFDDVDDDERTAATDLNTRAIARTAAAMPQEHRQRAEEGEIRSMSARDRCSRLMRAPIATHVHRLEPRALAAALAMGEAHTIAIDKDDMCHNQCNPYVWRPCPRDERELLQRWMGCSARRGSLQQSPLERK